MRKPDVSFVAAGRLPGERIPSGHLRIAPDLAVEVISPNDRYAEVLVKVDDYLRAEVSLVWVVSPETRSVLVFRAAGTLSLLPAEHELEGENVLPGFRCRVAEIFPPAAAVAP